MGWIYLTQDKDQWSDFCEHGHEYPSFIKDVESFD
jgi:hypothetical protein